ncbi:hypothetical protein GCM10027275_30830 [Rhabdobacter roseus]|uniref:Lin1244/Lin1753-like N-terminal domain-containing protein n=1 Tax=Rhabdobacter roseus TaxID=1655419 RepID=A0A840TU06_9BACT|nr:DUF4373 domain-containing protein [Rhabdobacter roseus]MBB5285042.1 hypothetical protein [Rhabdobacter roseus]
MKNTQYFPHDYNARNDPAISILISEFGAAGYGIYWCLIEMLHEEEDNRILVKELFYRAICVKMMIDAEQVKAIVGRCLEYELLQVDEGYLYSNRVLRNVEKREKALEQRSAAGRASAESRRRKANSTTVERPLNETQQPFNESQRTSTNKIKGKEKKENINIPFDVFWDSYDNKVGRAASQKKWEKLTDQERDLALQDIPKYIEWLIDRLPDHKKGLKEERRKYQNYPLKYLNGQHWLDERAPVSLPPTTPAHRTKILQ